MTWLARPRCRASAALFAARRLDDDFDDEVRAHLAMLTDDNIRRGLPPGEARRAGDRCDLEDRCRSRNSTATTAACRSSRRRCRTCATALRALRKNPAYSLVAIATLAIGIGAGTAVFSVAGAVLLRPLPYARSRRAGARSSRPTRSRSWTRNIAAPANYADWKTQNTVFTDIAAYEQFNTNGSGASDVFLTGFGEPQGLKSLGVTGNLFQVLGAAPLMGRTFTDDETFEGKARVAILSYGLWQSGVRRRSGDRRQHRSR